MCPLFSPSVLLILFVGPIFLLCSAFTATFEPKALTVHMHTTGTANLTLDGLPQLSTGSYVLITSNDNRLADVSKRIEPSEVTNGRWSGDFDVYGVFLGNPNVYVDLYQPNASPERANEFLPLTIIREDRAIDHAFTGSVATLVALLYINFGAALDVTKLKGILKRPVGPIIGFCGQFIVMPLVSKCFTSCYFSILSIPPIHSARFRPWLFVIPQQCGNATGNFFHWLFTGRWCLKHMDDYIRRKYGSFHNHDINQYTGSIWYDAVLDIYVRKSDI